MGRDPSAVPSGLTTHASSVRMGIALKFVLIREIRVTPYCNTYGSEDLPKRNGRPRRFFHLLNFINNFSGALAQIGIMLFEQRLQHRDRLDSETGESDVRIASHPRIGIPKRLNQRSDYLRENHSDSAQGTCSHCSDPAVFIPEMFGQLWNGLFRLCPDVTQSASRHLPSFGIVVRKREAKRPDRFCSDSAHGCFSDVGAKVTAFSELQ